jgi:septum formation protein
MGAGIDPVVIVSQVDEDAVLGRLLASQPCAPPSAQVLALAQAKAREVAGGEVVRGVRNAIVLGCDSMLELDGEVLGKPRDAADAVARITQQSGREATLHTGHWLIDLRAAGAAPEGCAVGRDVGPAAGGRGTGAVGGVGAVGAVGAVGEQNLDDADATSRTASAGWPDREVGAVSSTTVRFATLSDAEITAYVATGEPLHVAGAFTIDGLGGPFIEGIVGDHHGVVGLSLPTFRRLLGTLGLTVMDVWRR